MNNTQPSKPDRKGIAITSFILGIISIITLPGSIIVYEIFRKRGTIEIHDLMFLTAITMLLGLIIGLAGFICGIIGLKSSKKKFAIVGIILPLLLILCLIYFF